MNPAAFGHQSSHCALVVECRHASAGAIPSHPPKATIADAHVFCADGGLGEDKQTGEMHGRGAAAHGAHSYEAMP